MTYIKPMIPDFWPIQPSEATKDFFSKVAENHKINDIEKRLEAIESFLADEMGFDPGEEERISKVKKLMEELGISKEQLP